MHTSSFSCHATHGPPSTEFDGAVNVDVGETLNTEDEEEEEEGRARDLEVEWSGVEYNTSASSL